MARLVLAVVGAAVVGLAVWAALPSREPEPAPELTGPVAPREVKPTSPTPMAPTPPPVAGALATSGDPATDGAIAACVRAQLQVMQAREQRGGPAPPGQPTDAAVVSRACAPLYKQPACREAMLKYDEPPPERRSVTVLQACARAYCPQLSSPKPAVCEHVENPPQDVQQFQEWSQLREAILVKEIGPSATRIVTNPPRRAQPPAQPPR